MREVIVRFEDSVVPAGADANPRGLIIPGSAAGRPIRFDGWLHLLSLLEDVSLERGEDQAPSRLQQL